MAWTSTALIPAYCAAFSAVILLAGVAIGNLGWKSELPSNTGSSLEAERLHGFGTYLRLFFCRLVQLLVVLGLLGISASTYLWRDNMHDSQAPAIQIAQCALYVCPGDRFFDVALNANFSQGYVGLLALLAILGTPPLEHRAFIHASIVLAVTWFVYMYRDVWPLATLTEPPADQAEGKFLWAKVALLSLGGVLVPLLTPRKYTSTNPEVCVSCILLRCVAHVLL